MAYLAPFVFITENDSVELDPVKLRKIKMLVMDVDGVMTDAKIWYDGKEWRRFFCIKDGVGIKRLVQSGYQTAVITGSRAEDIRMRVKSLGIHHYYEGALDKLPAFEELLLQTGFSAEEVAYIGDDYFDLPILQRVGIGVTVPNALPVVLEQIKKITQHQGGDGAVRELCDWIYKYGAYAQEGAR